MHGGFFRIDKPAKRIYTIGITALAVSSLGSVRAAIRSYVAMSELNDAFRDMDRQIKLLMKRPVIAPTAEGSKAKEAPSVFDNLARRMWTRNVLDNPNLSEGLPIANGEKLLLLSSVVPDDDCERRVWAVDSKETLWELKLRYYWEDNRRMVDVVEHGKILDVATGSRAQAVADHIRTIAHEQAAKCYAQLRVMIEMF